MKEILVECYAQNHDTTFVMRETFDESGDIIKMECVGWYCGEPNEELTKMNCSGDMIALL